MQDPIELCRLIEECSIIADSGNYNISESDANEYTVKMENVPQPPSFEVKNTMKGLTSRKWPSKSELNLMKEKPCYSNINISNPIIEITPPKCQSLMNDKRIHLEKIFKKCTTNQWFYLKQIFEERNNYLDYALGPQKLYYQYSELSKEDMSFIKKEKFLANTKELMKFGSDFNKDATIPDCNF